MLEVNNLNVFYGAIHALKGISLTVGDGELVSLIVANGAGKTTTLHAISGLLPVASGSILLDGRDLQKVAPNKIISLGLAHVPEGRHVFARMTVEENLRMGAYIQRDTKQIDKNLDKVYTWSGKAAPKTIGISSWEQTHACLQLPQAACACGKEARI